MFNFLSLASQRRTGNDNLQVAGVSPEAVARAMACYLVRKYGFGRASALSDIIVGAVQAHGRKPCPCCPEPSDEQGSASDRD